jgi:hypothetical protein
LPPQQQEEFAAFILEELGAEERWQSALARSGDPLAALADEALSEYRRGESKPFESDRDLTHD